MKPQVSTLNFRTLCIRDLEVLRLLPLRSILVLNLLLISLIIK